MKCVTTPLQEVSVVAIGLTCCIINQNQNIRCGLRCDGRFVEEMPHKKLCVPRVVLCIREVMC
jgi:hypothetical protein